MSLLYVLKIGRRQPNKFIGARARILVVQVTEEIGCKGHINAMETFQEALLILKRTRATALGLN